VVAGSRFDSLAASSVLRIVCSRYRARFTQAWRLPGWIRLDVSRHHVVSAELVLTMADSTALVVSVATHGSDQAMQPTAGRHEK